MKARLFALSCFVIFLGILGTRSVECLAQKPDGQNITRDEAITLFTDANNKYQQAAKFIAAKNNQGASQALAEATTEYETVLANGFRHGQIYYNLGNTYYRQGELGKAIVNYRKARRLLPRNADIVANLKLAKYSTEDKEFSNEVPAVIRGILPWFFLLNQNELMCCAASLYGILMIMLFLFVVFKYLWLRKYLLGFSVALFIAVVSLGVKIYHEDGVGRGVVVVTKCQVRYGPGEEYEPKFEIHNGAECVIEEEKDDWYRVYVNVGVKLDTGSKAGTEEKAGKEIRRGWLRKKDVDVI